MDLYLLVRHRKCCITALTTIVVQLSNEVSDNKFIIICIFVSVKCPKYHQK